MNPATSFPVADLGLALRLEQTEGRACAGFVDARAIVDSGTHARRIDVAGALAMFDTAESPMTQTFGLGLFGKVTAVELTQIEDFYRQRNAPVLHEVSPLADPDLLPLLTARGYRPIELTNVMYRPTQVEVPPPVPSNDRLRVRLVPHAENDAWAGVSVAGWSESLEFQEAIREIARLHPHIPGVFSFMAEMDGKPIATAALFIWERVALLAGASTIPEARRNGAQLALLEGRLRFAAEQGCDLAMVCGLPGGPTQRNAERHGFRIAYTRIKWRLEPAAMP